MRVIQWRAVRVEACVVKWAVKNSQAVECDVRNQEVRRNGIRSNMMEKRRPTSYGPDFM